MSDGHVMTNNPDVTVTASDNDKLLPIGLLVAETQFDLLCGPVQELLHRCAILEDANRALIDQAQNAADHARLQLMEVEHRLKNTFSTVQALVAQSARSGDTGEAFRDVFRPRLLALARSHEFLGAHYSRGAPLDLILARCLEPFEEQPTRIVTTGPRIYLRASDVLPIGLAFHELTTNAAKHGALSAPEGKVEVKWSLETRRADRRRSVVIIWRERGGPVVAPPSRRGFGSRLLERGLSHSVDGGTTQLDFAPSGVECRIWLPLSNARNKLAV